MKPAPEFLAAQSSYFDTPPCRTVRRAAADCGGLERLAERVGGCAADLRHWYAGESLPPTPIFLKALDIVARGPVREIRVCVPDGPSPSAASPNGDGGGAKPA
jgi:hypothetical protein